MEVVDLEALVQEEVLLEYVQYQVLNDHYCRNCVMAFPQVVEVADSEALVQEEVPAEE